MEVVVVAALFLVGLALIVKGGDIFVDAAGWIAQVSGIPRFIVGATIVSFATTLPELLVSLIAASQGKVDMAIGNAVGSVTANLGLIMAISILFLPGALARGRFAFKGILMVAACLCLYLFSRNGSLSLWQSIVMLLLFAVFLVENLHSARRSLTLETGGAPQEKPARREVLVNCLKFLLGAAGIVLGAQLLVDNGSAIARLLGVPESIIAVTMVAIGTSLPELVTTITAIVKRQSSLSIGNIVGANIIDLTVILPLCGVVSGGSLPVAAQSVTLDLPVCLAVCLFAVLPPLLSQKLARWQGAAMLGLYLAYLVFLCA